MTQFKHRDLSSVGFHGERIDFIATNDRLQERVENLSHERHILDKLVSVARPDDVVWDVGACLGIHTFTVAKHLPDGEVIAFEPMPTNRGVLIDNMTVNQLDNVRVRREALSDENGKREFAIRESLEAGYGRHSFATGDYDALRTIDVPTARGDSLAIGEIPAPNVVKIDVEGAGPLVINGMKPVLERDSCRHVILETHAPNPVQPSHEDYGYTEEDIREMLEELGFNVETLIKDYHLYARKTDTSRAIQSDVDINIIQGDIVDCSADALVSSTGTSLRMGTGVAGAIRQAAGEEMYRQALNQSPADLGEAIVTDAPELDADHIIHAVGMPHYGKGKATTTSVRRAVKSALETAEHLECEHIVIPAIGCGLGGLPLTTGADIILDEVQAHEADNLLRVDILGYTEEERETIEMIA